MQQPSRPRFLDTIGQGRRSAPTQRVSPTSVGIAPAAAVLGSPKYCGKVLLTGLGTPNEMKFVADGTVESFVLWNPANLGCHAAYAAVELASERSPAPRARPSPRASSAASL
jgi:hypothetical protein